MHEMDGPYIKQVIDRAGLTEAFRDLSRRTSAAKSRPKELQAIREAMALMCAQMEVCSRHRTGHDSLTENQVLEIRLKAASMLHGWGDTAKALWLQDCTPATIKTALQNARKAGVFPPVLSPGRSHRNHEPDNRGDQRGLFDVDGGPAF